MASRDLRLALGAVLLVAAQCGCATAQELPQGRGLFWSWTPERLEQEGYPGYRDEYSSPQWGILYDQEGITYGPKSFYSGRTRLEHPHLTVTDEWLQSRWLRIYRSECCTESLLGHFLEISDLAWYQLSERLRYRPDHLLEMFVADTIEDFRKLTGRDYWVTHVVDGDHIVMSPVSVLFRRTLAGHAAYAAIAQSLLDLKCRGGIPPWIREGLSSYLAQEGFEHLSFMVEFRDDRSILMTPAEVQRWIFPLRDRENGRIARYNAFLMVWHLSEQHGWQRIQELLDLVEAGERFDAAVLRVYGVDVDGLLERIDASVLGEPTTTLPSRTGH